MKQLRQRRGFLWLAFCAFAAQFVLSLGHMHSRGDAHGTSLVEHIVASFAGTHDCDDPRHAHEHGHKHKHKHHRGLDCQLCVAIAVAGSGVAPQVLLIARLDPVPVAPSWRDNDTSARPRIPAATFQARAPPVV